MYFCNIFPNLNKVEVEVETHSRITITKMTLVHANALPSIEKILYSIDFVVVFVLESKGLQ